jgi:Nucleoside 2-deoxyribosyltransferase like
MRRPRSPRIQGYVEAPNLYTGAEPALFLAGGITGCPDWQTQALHLLRRAGVDWVILNPRRPDYPVADPAAAAEQTAWEYQHLQAARAILFWFPPSASAQPIALYELGACAAGGATSASWARPDGGPAAASRDATLTTKRRSRQYPRARGGPGEAGIRACLKQARLAVPPGGLNRLGPKLEHTTGRESCRRNPEQRRPGGYFGPPHKEPQHWRAVPRQHQPGRCAAITSKQSALVAGPPAAPAGRTDSQNSLLAARRRWRRDGDDNENREGDGHVPGAYDQVWRSRRGPSGAVRQS